jgi:hypothetical protein
MTEEKKTNNKYEEPEISSKEYLYMRLAEIQKSLKAPKTKKHFQGWKHRSAEDILNAVKPYLDGLSIILTDEIVSTFPPFLYEKTEKNEKINFVLSGIYIKSTANLNSGHHSISASSCVKESADKAGLDDPQLSGIATSYARKYALCGLLGIDGSEDADEHNDYEHRSQVEKQQKPQSTQQKPREKNEWEKKLLEQANNDEGILREISEAWDKGIKSEKQYYFFARNLADRGFPSGDIEPTVCSQELNAEKIGYVPL